MYAPVRITGKAHHLEHFIHPPADISGIETPHLERKSDIAGHRHMRKQGKPLKYHSN